jgi:APA family basic amino acid/polyamine antiporter
MGIHRQVPDQLRQLHPKFRTPWIGIILFGIIASILMIPGKAVFLGNLYAFGAMLSFTIAHVSLIRLRIKRPDEPRPYRGPGNVTIAGKDIPVFALVGGFGTLAAFITVVVQYKAVAATGVGWLMLGVLIYILYRRRMGLNLTTTAKVAIPKPVVDHEAEYDSVLVGFDETHGYREDVLATAVRLAARRRRGIFVLVTITVPATVPITAELPQQEMRAQEVIEQAKLAGGRRVSGRWEKVRAGEAGRRIVDEAREMKARAIVMPMPRRASGGSLFGKTLETVLSERPCRVIIEAGPAGRGGAEPVAA